MAAPHGLAARENLPLSDSVVVEQHQPTRARPPSLSPPPLEPCTPSRPAKRTVPPPPPPQAAWRAGVQMVALNLQTNDAPVQLHDALFRGSGGYVLKPAALRAPDRAIRPPPHPRGAPSTPIWPAAVALAAIGRRARAAWPPLVFGDGAPAEGAIDGRGKLWPPPREEVHRTELKAPRSAAAPLGPPSSQLTERPTAARCSPCTSSRRGTSAGPSSPSPTTPSSRTSATAPARPAGPAPACRARASPSSCTPLEASARSRASRSRRPRRRA